MARYVALLRAINVGGHTVKMDRLRSLFEELRFSAVSTFIASGNVIFDAGARDAAGIARRIERHLWQALGYEVATFIRTPAELSAVAAYEPFPRAELDAPASTLYVIFLSAPPTKETARKFDACRTEAHDFHIHGRELYWLRRDPRVVPPLSGPQLERLLGTPGTSRNVTTVRKLADLLGTPATRARPAR